MILSNQLYTEKGYQSIPRRAGIALAGLFVALAMRHGRAPATGGASSHLGIADAPAPAGGIAAAVPWKAAGTGDSAPRGARRRQAST